jgi:hypothetical protein
MAQQATEQGDEPKVLAIQQAISLRQDALQSVRRGGKTTQQGQPSSGLSPEFQSRALNFSQSTRNAIQMQKPDMASVLRDVFSVDGNSYFNTQAGSQIFVGNNSTANDPAYLKPSGDFTVFGRSPAGIENLMSIKQSLLYTMASPAWDDADKAYLEYLLGRINQQIEILQNALSINQNSSIVQSGLNQQVNIEQNIMNPGNNKAQQTATAANNNNNAKTQNDNDNDIQQKMKQNTNAGKEGQKIPDLPNRGGGFPGGGFPGW